ncbi:MAG: hypothetical protein OEY79_05115 [Anaplasmataceae bacterium]|nr:hypothetical protein [Anaplasmataceae bacterium]
MTYRNNKYDLDDKITEFENKLDEIYNDILTKAKDDLAKYIEDIKKDFIKNTFATNSERDTFLRSFFDNLF